MSLTRLAVILLGLFLAGDAHAQGDPCAEAHAAWRQRCSERSGVPLRVVQCPAGRVVLRAGQGEDAVDIELAPASGRSFRSVGATGASPIGEFPDWSREPQARQDAFAAVVGCLDDLAAFAEQPIAPLTPERRPPWLLLGAILALGAVGWAARRPRRARLSLRDACAGRSLGGAVALGALAILTFAARWLAFPTRFFHQNGQGPLWIDAAWQGGRSFRYGPGYAELFGLAAGTSPRSPEVPVFGAMALLGATVPASGFILTRMSGASPAVSWVVAALLALHPLLGRLAHGESYLGAQLAVLAAAAAALAWGGRASRRGGAGVRGEEAVVGRSGGEEAVVGRGGEEVRGERGGRGGWIFGGAVVAAGLLVAQGARVHPTGWLAAAVVPLVLLVQPGRPWAQVRRTVLAGLGIGAVVLVTSGGALWGVYRGPLGQQWEPSSLLQLPRVSWLALVLAAALLLRGRWRVVLAVGSGVVAVVVLRAADLLEANAPWIADAYRFQFFPPVLASAAALLSMASGRLRAASGRWRRAASWLPVLVLAAGIAGIAARWRGHRTIPTDALEQAWATGWREQIPPGAPLVYLRRAGDRIVMLPLPADRWHVRAVDTGQEPLVSPLRSGAYYYRSSLCATAEGGPACEALERGATLDLIEEKTLPVIASLPWMPLTGASIRVALLRVR